MRLGQILPLPLLERAGVEGAGEGRGLVLASQLLTPEF